MDQFGVCHWLSCGPQTLVKPGVLRVLAWLVRVCWRPAHPATYSVRIHRGAARPDAHFGVRTRGGLRGPNSSSPSRRRRWSTWTWSRPRRRAADDRSSSEGVKIDRERELKGRFAPRLVALAAAICPNSKVRRKRSARGRRRASAPSLHTTRPPLARSARTVPFRAHPQPRRRFSVLAVPCWGAQGPEHRHGNTKPGLACCPVGGGGGVDGHRFPCPLALCRAEKPGTYPHLMAAQLILAVFPVRWCSS